MVMLQHWDEEETVMAAGWFARTVKKYQANDAVLVEKVRIFVVLLICGPRQVCQYR